EVAKGYVYRGEIQFTLDDVRHYPFPWMLRATAESYETGKTAQRARALVWLEQALKTPLRPADFRNEFWTMAETLFALRQVQGLLEPKGSKEAVSQRSPQIIESAALDMVDHLAADDRPQKGRRCPANQDAGSKIRKAQQ